VAIRGKGRANVQGPGTGDLSARASARGTARPGNEQAARVAG